VKIFDRIHKQMDRVVDWHSRKSPRVSSWIASGGLMALFGLTFLETEGLTAPGINAGSRACICLWAFWAFTAFCQAHGRAERQKRRADRLLSQDSATQYYYRQNLAKLNDIQARLDEGEAWKR
jgi:hypothetical protein